MQFSCSNFLSFKYFSQKEKQIIYKPGYEYLFVPRKAIYLILISRIYMQKMFYFKSLSMISSFLLVIECKKGIEDIYW